MSTDAEMITNAIISLKTNYIQDYILPVFTVLISSILSVGVARYTVNKQEKNKIELTKIKAVNNTFLSALALRSDLIGIKSNYNNLDTDEPLIRVINVPPIMLTPINYNFDFSELSFIAPKDERSANNWNNIEYISSIIANYYVVYEAWKKRNDLLVPVLIRLQHLYPTGVTPSDIESSIDPTILFQLSDLTERCLSLTDDILIEITCFIIAFDFTIKGKIDKKVLRQFGNLMRPTLPNYKKSPFAVDIIGRTISVNYKSLSKLHGQPIDALQKRYAPIYP